MAAKKDGPIKTRLAPARTTDELKAAVIKDRPALAAAPDRLDTVAAALIVRGWVSDFACLSARELVFVPPDPLSAYRIMNSMAGGMWAEGCARFFAMLLNLFSIPALTYSYRDESLKMSHETTLFFDRASNRIYAADAYLNYHFANSGDGRIMDFETFCECVRGGRYAEIKIEERPVSRPYITQMGDRAHNRWLFPSEEDMAALLDFSWPGVWVYHGAAPSLSGLMSEGLLHDICQHCRGSLDARDFLLSLMLSSPKINGSFDIDAADTRLKDTLGVDG